MPEIRNTAHAPAPVPAPVGRTAYGVRRPLRSAPRIERGLLHEWHLRNRRITLPHGIAMLDEYGTLDNVRRLTGEAEVDFRGMLFADSDIYKTLEATAWELGREDDAALRTFFDQTVSLIERAQQEDGYLDSAYLGRDDRHPWSDFAQGHELYCLGHLVQAAVGAHRALEDDRLLRVAERFVAHVVARMGADDAVEYCGHPLIEAALVELYRTTGDAAALDLAAAFIRRRGSGFLGGVLFGAAYYQDEQPALQVSKMRGHAVRALYLNQGITDVYLETGDAAMLEVMRTQWDDLVSRRMYLTGGTGARHEDEAFGEAFELPPDRAYAETCAGVALFGWAWRMYLATGDAACMDVAETALYNVIAAGISTSGDSFTYVNPLQVRDETPYGGDAPAGRRRWFSCACCPPNLMRTFASLEHHLAAERDDGLDIVLYASATLQAHGATVTIDTAYPADGSIRISIDGDAAEGSRRLALRAPGWASAHPIALHRDGVVIDAVVEGGWIVIEDALQDGTVIELQLPVEAEIIHPHPRIDAVRGCVAVRRGPVVYGAVGDVDGLVVDGRGLGGARVVGDARSLGDARGLGDARVVGGTPMVSGARDGDAAHNGDAATSGSRTGGERAGGSPSGGEQVGDSMVGDSMVGDSMAPGDEQVGDVSAPGDEQVGDVSAPGDSNTRGLLGPRLTLEARRLSDTPHPLYAHERGAAPTERTTVELRPFAEYDGGVAMRVWMPTRTD